MLMCLPFRACGSVVETIDRRHEKLQQVPDEVLRSFQTLEECRLDANQIRELPRNFFRLKRIRFLTLSDNELTYIPSGLGSLVSLVELDLSRNNISELPKSIRLCDCLQTLELSNNPLQALPDGFCELRNLRILSMNEVSLSELPSDFGNLRQLEKCELRDNCLKTLPDSFSKLENLELLDIGANEFHVVPLVVCALPSLTELLIDDNELKSLPPHIGQLHHLQQLDVSENLIDSLPEEVAGLASLSDLKLSQNNLNCLPSGLGQMKSLVVLKVDQNRLLSLTPSVGNCSCLQELYLTENFLPSLPSTMGNLSSLLLLNVDKNQLTELPPQIGQCTSLTILSLRENMLRNLPEDIGHCCRLRVLDVSGNRMERLPPSLTNCPLTALWLSANQSQPVFNLQRDVDLVTGEHFLTCYLLPQEQADSPAELGDTTGLSPLELGNFAVPVPTSGDALPTGGDHLTHNYQNNLVTDDDAFSGIPAEVNYAYEATGPLRGEPGRASAPSWSATSGDGQDIEEEVRTQHRRHHCEPVHHQPSSPPPADTSTASLSSRTTKTTMTVHESPHGGRHPQPPSSLSTGVIGNTTSSTTTTPSSSSPTSQHHFRMGSRQDRRLDPNGELGTHSPFMSQLAGLSRVHFSSALDTDDQSEHSSAKDFPKTLHPRLVKKPSDWHHSGRDSSGIDRVSARDRMLNCQLTSPAPDSSQAVTVTTTSSSRTSTGESPAPLGAQPRSSSDAARLPSATSWRVPTGSPRQEEAEEERRRARLDGDSSSPPSEAVPTAKSPSPDSGPRNKQLYRTPTPAVTQTQDSTHGKLLPNTAGFPSVGMVSSGLVDDCEYENAAAEVAGAPDDYGNEGGEEDAYSSGGEEICGISKRVGFTEDVEDNEEKANQKLIRRDTPHYTKRARIQSKAADGVANTKTVLKIMEKYLAGVATDPASDYRHVAAPLSSTTTVAGEPVPATGSSSQDTSTFFSLGSQSSIRPSQDSVLLQIYMHRADSSTGLGLSIAGGVGSVPYLGDDQGIFVSRLNPTGLAHASGLRLHDKLLQVNGTSLISVEHKVAVATLRANTNDFHLVVLRYNPVEETTNALQLFPLSSPTAYQTATLHSPPNSLIGETNNQTTPQLIRCTLRREGPSGLGLSIAGGRGFLPTSTSDRPETIVISKISETGAAHKCGKLRVGDQLVKVNGVDVKNARHEQALLLLSGSGSTVDIEVLRSLDSSEKHYSRKANGRDGLLLLQDGVSWPSQATPIRKDAASLQPPHLSAEPSGLLKLSAVATASPVDKAGGEIGRTDGSYSVDLVTIRREENRPLGLTIYGGSDTCCRPFGGSTNEPGIFISKVSPTGCAIRSGLRVGDRLLQVNDRDLRNATHDEAVQALIQSSAKELLLKVRHDPTPPGLRRLLITRQQPGERLGLRVAGGVSPANAVGKSQLANNNHDDGLFVTSISADGAVARDGRLRLGDRLLEVNGTWVMGSTLDEALTCFHGTGNQLDLIVCDGPIELASQLSTSQTVAVSGAARSLSTGIQRTGGPIDDRSVDDAGRLGEKRHLLSGRQALSPSASAGSREQTGQRDHSDYCPVPTVRLQAPPSAGLGSSWSSGDSCLSGGDASDSFIVTASPVPATAHNLVVDSGAKG